MRLFTFESGILIPGILIDRPGTYQACVPLGDRDTGYLKMVRLCSKQPPQMRGDWLMEAVPIKIPAKEPFWILQKPSKSEYSEILIRFRLRSEEGPNFEWERVRGSAEVIAEGEGYTTEGEYKDLLIRLRPNTDIEIRTTNKSMISVQCMICFDGKNDPKVLMPEEYKAKKKG